MSAESENEKIKQNAAEGVAGQAPVKTTGTATSPTPGLRARIAVPGALEVFLPDTARPHLRSPTCSPSATQNIAGCHGWLTAWRR